MNGLDHVLWIGGASGAGKTTVAGRLARRWGLRLYSADTRTWEHRDRAIAAGIQAAVRFEKLSHEERLAAPIEDRREMDLVLERPLMVADDLRHFPTSPRVLAEGTSLPVGLVDPGRSVWLIPTSEFQSRHRPGERTSIRPIEEVVRDADTYGIRVVSVDGRRPVGAIVDEVEEFLAPAISSGSVASTLGERQTLIWEANLAVIHQIRSGCSRPWATNVADTQVRMFMCECGELTCDVELSLPVGTAAGAGVIAAGHPRN